MPRVWHREGGPPGPESSEISGPRWLLHPSLPAAAALLGVLLCLPGLGLGPMLDDHYHRVMLEGHPQLGEPKPITDLFAFGEASASPVSLVPWWAADDLRFRFFRPLASLSHALDYTLWPDTWAAMHAQSLLWLGLVVFAAAALYRRLAPGSAVAAMAALLFAVDDAHAAPALWLANRSALMSLFFGILAVTFHHRSRRDEWGAGRWAAPLALALAMLCGESGLAGGAYLLAYALVLDRGRLRERLGALVPCTVVGVAWALHYRLGGYGTVGSALYVDPAAEPLRFAALLVDRLPKLILGQFGFPPPDVFVFLSEGAGRIGSGLALLASVGLAVLAWRMLNRQASVRFFALGLLLSALPLCATLPSSRLLAPVSLGGSFVLAALLVDLWRTVVDGGGRVWRGLAGLALGTLVFLHLVVAPITLASSTGQFRQVERYFTGGSSTLPDDPSASVVLVNAPNFYLVSLAPVAQAASGESLPAELLTLSTGVYGVEYERTDESTLRIRPDGGFLLPPGHAPPGQQPPTFDFRHFLQMADQLYRRPAAFVAGERIRRGEAILEIVEVTSDGRPSVVDVRFATPLEGRQWIQFVEWRGFEPWAVPAVGETVRIGAMGPQRRPP